MKVLVVTHGPEITPGWLADAIEDVGAVPEIVDVSVGETLDGRAFDKVIVLGGHMGVYDTDVHPWLEAEKEFIRSQLEEETPVLGVCLGSQLVAEAAGGSAYRAPDTEAGLFEIQLTEAGSHDNTVAAIDGAVVVWHHDTFDLPPGAELLARTTRYPHAYRVGSALGVQFHPEVTPEMWKAWVAAAGTAELVEAGVEPAELGARVEAESGRLRAQAVRFFRAWLEE